jgi:hypothetical protein
VVGIQEVRNGRRPTREMEGSGTFPDLAVGHRGAVVLAEMFAPRLDHEGLQEATLLGNILVEPPVYGSVPSANAAEFKHG